MGIQTHQILLRKERKEKNSWEEREKAREMIRETNFPKREEQG
jgi:hypothetical protein